MANNKKTEVYTVRQNGRLYGMIKWKPTWYDKKGNLHGTTKWMAMYMVRYHGRLYSTIKWKAIWYDKMEIYMVTIGNHCQERQQARNFFSLDDLMVVDEYILIFMSIRSPNL